MKIIERTRQVLENLRTPQHNSCNANSAVYYEILVLTFDRQYRGNDLRGVVLLIYTRNIIFYSS